MAKVISLRQRFLSVLFWSIISAAFIGPGTVTTASKAGANFGLSLVWALVFSIVATIILQEAAARITIASGKSLGEIIAIKYQNSNSSSLKIALFLAVAFGCAAYQAGNMLGAISGIALVSTAYLKIWTFLLAIICAVLLWIGNYKIIANILGLVVAFMGIAFIYVAFQADVGSLNVLGAALVPSLPDGAMLLVIGLIGTTIVPYNLFLASGISKGQEIQEMRWGLTLAVLIGGMISIAILIVGTQVQGAFSFQSLADALAANLGTWAVAFLGFGLFAAGLSSSITSPLAAAITAQSLFGAKDANWSVQSRNFRLVWVSILGIGLLFGLTEIKPIPAIIMAQAINGALLPIVTIFLLLSVNDEKLLTSKYTNSVLTNILMLIIVGITCFLGINNVLKAMSNVLPEGLITIGMQYGIVGMLTLGLLIWVGRKVFLKNK